MIQNNSKIRLVAVDLDGTLLTSPNPVDQSVQNAGQMPFVTPIAMARDGAKLLRAVAGKGVHVILVTGRVLDSTRELCGSLGISSPVICTDGAQIYDSIEGPIWRSITFPQEVGLEIARLADANGWEMGTTVGTTTYYRQRPGQALGQFAPARAIAATNADGVTGNPTRILVSNPEAANQILRLCQSRFAGRCRTQLYNVGPDGNIGSLGILGCEANKGDALSLVMERLGVDESGVMAIGDDLNDLPMLSRARIKIAMGNAQPELKAQATAVAPSNDEEGVAWALREFGVSRIDQKASSGLFKVK